MKSAFPRIAAIVFTIASIAMMGTSIASYFNRLDYVAQMKDPLVADYEFTLNRTGGNEAWTVTPSQGEDQTARQKSSGYAALEEAYKLKASRLNSETIAAQQLTSQLIQQTERVSAEQQEDRDALDRRIAALKNQVAGLEQNYQVSSQEFQKLSVETLAIRNDTAERREDVVRLKSELEELRTDRFRLQELRRDLSDQLLRLELENQLIQERLQQLKQQTSNITG